MKLQSLLLALLMVSTTAFAIDVTGDWQITISATGPDGTTRNDSGVAVLHQNGNVVTGTLGPDISRQSPISEGTIKDSKIILKASPQPDRTMTFELTVSGEKLVGIVSRPGDNRTATVEFVRSVKK